MSEGGKRRALWLTGVGHLSAHSWELICPAISLPLAADLDIPVDEALALSFPLYLMLGLGAPIGGWLTDRIGGRKVLLMGLTGGGLSGIGISIIPQPGEHLALLELGLALLGLSASFYHPAGLALLSRSFEKTGRAFAINGMIGNLGIVAAPFVAGLSSVFLGWKFAFLVLTLPSLLAALVFSLLPFDDPSANAPRAAGSRRPKGSRASGLDGASLALMAVCVVGGGLAYRLHTLVLPALLHERVAWVAQLPRQSSFGDPSIFAATALTSLAYTLGLAGQWLGGKLADGERLARSYLLFVVLGIPCFLLATSLNGAGFLAAIMLFVFFGLGAQPIENSLIVRLTPEHLRGRAFAGKFILGFGVGSLGSYIVGLVSPFGGLGASFYVSAGLLSVVALALLVLSRREERAGSPVLTAPTAL